MKKKFKISSSITLSSDYSFNWEYNKNIFQWGRAEDIGRYCDMSQLSRALRWNVGIGGGDNGSPGFCILVRRLHLCNFSWIPYMLGFGQHSRLEVEASCWPLTSSFSYGGRSHLLSRSTLNSVEDCSRNSGGLVCAPHVLISAEWPEDFSDQHWSEFKFLLPQPFWLEMNSAMTPLSVAQRWSELISKL